MSTVKRWLSKWWVYVLVGGIVAILSFPHLASAYHLEAGGRCAADAERLTGNLLPAVSHLQRAIEWVPDNAQAHRLLAKVYRAQGDWPSAVEALMRYIELRPDNPLGHLELAEMYETIEADMATMHVTDLIAILPQATIEAPDVPLDTPYLQAEGSARHSYVAATAFSLPPNFGERPTLFMHSPSRIFYQLTLPTEPAVLRFGMGLAPEVIDWPGDGVTFEVWIDGVSVFQEHLEKSLARQGWQERMVDVSSWCGQTVILSLGVGPGTMADVSGDWAGWGEPQVLDARLPSLEALHPGARKVEAWQRAGVKAEDFIALGEKARDAKQYEEAMVWYERAMRLEPDLADTWYYIGQAYEEQQLWRQALDAYEYAIALNRFRRVHRSSPHYRMGFIYQWQLEPRRTDLALAAYEAAIEANDFSDDWQAADCHYKRGEILWWMDGDPDEYMAEYRRVIELHPEHASAHILLGVAYYLCCEDVTMAEAEIYQGLKLSPGNKWAYFHLGNIYRWAECTDEARAMYRQALEIDPTFETAQNHLSQLKDNP